MPGKKTIDLTKIKSSSSKSKDHARLTERKQVTISKFFSSSASTHNDNHDQTEKNSVITITDEEDILISKKRPREEFVDATGTLKKKFCLSGVASVDNEEACSSTDTQFPSTSVTRTLSQSTITKLKQFGQREGNSKSNYNPELLTSSKNVFNSHSSQVEECTPSSSHTEENDSLTTDLHPSTSFEKIERFSKYSSVSKQLKSPINKQTSLKFTPLEQQVVDIKKKYPDTVLFIECGYRYRFFGEDAEIAAEVLKIYCHPDHNFMTASIPTHRLFVHVRRLVSAGYKVGVVKQTETAALKAAGDNKSAPFTRQLTALYTKSTLIGEDVDRLSGMEEVPGDSTELLSTYLMCVYDAPPEKGSKQQTVGMMAIQPSTGDIIYDVFYDNDMRGELETRISHIQPVEVLIPQTATDQTQKLMNRMVCVSNTDDDRMRIERIEDEQFEYVKAFETVSKYYKTDSSNDEDVSRLHDIVNLPGPVMSCLACLLNYLREFNLHKVFKLTSNFTQFSIQSKFMQLSGNTVRNLELFQNLTDGKERGSLFWLINQTLTNFGGRLLKTWLSKPLLSHSDICQRHEAVQDLMSGSCDCCLKKLKVILSKALDLEKGLCSIYHKKCSVQEFYSVCRTFQQILDELQPQVETFCEQTSSDLLRQIIRDLPDLLSDIKLYSEAINPQTVKDNDKTKLFCDETQFPTIGKRRGEITDVEKELRDHRREIRLLLRLPSLDYVTVLGTEYLVEVKNNNLSIVPSKWIKISSTKAVSRFHSPFIEKKYKKLNQLREQLKLDCQEAWMEFLELFGNSYQRYKKAVHSLATLDCLLSLARVAQQHGYCRPEIKENTCIQIENGRHPIIHQLIGEHGQYVPNDASLSTDAERVMIITGPNMGGKSSYIKQVALLTILAQIGSFVPAESAKIGIVDAVFTRMGASDEIYKGRSTFMVELQEASQIMSKATSRSLVILDELGRGTSTHDGVAIAFATLNYFITEIKCMTLFVTHYPMLAEFEEAFPGFVKNYHMSFLLHDENEDQDSSSSMEFITFLYQLVAGVAAKSYGLNVAKLASLPDDIIKVAMEKSKEFEETVNNRRCQQDIFQALYTSTQDELIDVLQEFKQPETTFKS